MVKQIGVHEISVGLVMSGRQGIVFVQIIAGYILKRDFSCLVHSGKLLVHPYRCGAGSQTQNALGLGFQKVGNDFGAFLGHFLIIFANDDLHFFILRQTCLTAQNQQRYNSTVFFLFQEENRIFNIFYRKAGQNLKKHKFRKRP